ncbi:hypothetical protein RYX36_008969 [Vicia faba]
MSKASFKTQHPFERRQAESTRIRDKYPDRVPVIAEKAGRSDIADIDKKRYLVLADLSVGEFVYVARKRINLSTEKVIFVSLTTSNLQPLLSCLLFMKNIRMKMAFFT